MEAKILTPAQKVLLKMFSYNHSDEFAMEVKDVLTKHFQSKIDEEMDKMWDDGILNQDKLDSLRREDFHKSGKLHGPSCP